jgi:chromosome segregation ATPase
MRLTHTRNSNVKLGVPRDLYEKIGNQEKIIELMRIGLLSLRVASLDREIADLVERTEALKKRIVELPYETEKLNKRLEEFIKDQKTLETLLNVRR